MSESPHNHATIEGLHLPSPASPHSQIACTNAHLQYVQVAHAPLLAVIDSLEEVAAVHQLHDQAHIMPVAGAGAVHTHQPAAMDRKSKTDSSS